MRDRYIVRRMYGDSFYIYDMRRGMQDNVAVFPKIDEQLAHDTCLMLNNRERFWAFSEASTKRGTKGIPRSARKHAGINALILGGS